MKKKIALYGVFIALTLMVSFIESLIPLPIAIPGIKLGLANSVILFLLFSIGEKDAFFVSILRVRYFLPVMHLRIIHLKKYRKYR